MKLFNKHKSPHRKTLYAVTAGDYMGKFLMFLNKTPDKEHYYTLAVGEGREINSGSFTAMKIPVIDVDEGIKLKIIEPAGKITEEMYKLLYAQWQYLQRETDNASK